MGAFAPSPLIDEAMAGRIMREIVTPVLQGMSAEGTPFRGFLYVGLMITGDGPKVVEFNCRFGDPETQSLLPRLVSDLLPLLAGDLSQQPEVADRAAVTVVLSGGDYPERGDQGTPIEGVEAAEATGALVFHAVTALHDGRLVTNGGRILNVVGVGATVAEARTAAYDAAAHIHFAGMRLRTDIASNV
jgi:phosphoribosylamine--glycine ligase